jgi:hypothetical protein
MRAQREIPSKSRSRYGQARWLSALARTVACGYYRLMEKDPYLAELRSKRADLLSMLEPLESGRLISGNAQTNEARMHFLRRQISELDMIIDREEAP